MFMHVLINGILSSFKTEYYYVYLPHFFHLECFNIVGVMDKKAVNVWLQMCLGHTDLIPFGYIPGRKIAESYGFYFSFLELLCCFL